MFREHRYDKVASLLPSEQDELASPTASAKLRARASFDGVVDDDAEFSHRDSQVVGIKKGLT